MRLPIKLRRQPRFRSWIWSVTLNLQFFHTSTYQWYTMFLSVFNVCALVRIIYVGCIR